jgi:amidase
MGGEQLLSAPAVEQAARIRAGEVSALELVEAALEAIERRDGELGAFVALAAERARREAALVAPGDPRPLCGVPIGIKDLFTATEGLPTTHGSAAFGDWIADFDAPHVARLRAAGAIVLGKTNAAELGLRPMTEPARYGPTRNPRDSRRSAGGSSGGSAAAVGAGLVALCDGGDFGGSIRIPAACCGVVGLKPSAGLVPNGPDLDATVASLVACIGPIAQTVRDAAVALDVMAATDRFAAAAEPVATPAIPVAVALGAPLGVPVDAEPRAAAERAAALLADLGHDVAERTPAWEDDAFPSAWMTMSTAGMRQIIALIERAHGRPVDVAALEPASRAWMVDGPRPSERAVLEALQSLLLYARRILARWPSGSVLLTPTLTRTPAEVGALGARPGVTDDAVRFSAITRVFSVTGQPALTLPVGTMTGVQIVGPPGGDDLVLSVAADLEAALR